MEVALLILQTTYFSYLTNKPYYYFDYVGAKYNTTKQWKHYAQYPNNIEEIIMSMKPNVKMDWNCYAETEAERTIGGLKCRKNKPNYYKGKIKVLINGGCFSTTRAFTGFDAGI